MKYLVQDRHKDRLVEQATEQQWQKSLPSLMLGPLKRSNCPDIKADTPAVMAELLRFPR